MASKSFPRVSIVIISYNHGRFIKQCIESIVHQSYQDFELIVVDNNSADDSRTVISELSEKYGFERVFNSENIGLPAVLNNAITSTQSEYIVFMAADDYMVFDRIQIQIEFLDQHADFYACAGGQLKVDAQNNFLSLKHQKNTHDKFMVVDSTNVFSRTNVVYSPTAMYRVGQLKVIGGYNPDIAIEDLYLFYKAALNGLKVAILPKIFTFYRIHGNNSHAKYMWMYENKLKILSEYRDTCHYNELYKLIHLEAFYSLSAANKSEALKIIPKVMTCFSSLYLYAGLVKLIFFWNKK